MEGSGQPVRFSTVRLAVCRSCRVRRVRDVSRVLRIFCTRHGVCGHVRRGSTSLQGVIAATLRHGRGGCRLRRGRRGSTRGQRGCGLCKRLVGMCNCGLRSRTGRLIYRGFCSGGGRVHVPLSPRGATHRGSRGCFSGCKGLGQASRTLRIRLTRAGTRVSRLRSVRGSLGVTLSTSSLIRVGRRLVRCNFVGGRGRNGGRGVGDGPFRCVSSSNCSVCINGGGCRGSRLAFGFTAKGS